MSLSKIKKNSLRVLFFIFVSHIFFSVGYSNIKINTLDLKLADNDAYIYRDIAENGLSKHRTDHRSTRILIPGISYAISKINFLDQKFNTPEANIFFVCSVISFLSLISLMYLARLHFNQNTSFISASLFLVSFSMSNYMFMGYPDSAEFLLSTLLFIALTKKRFLYIFPIFFMAALNRESFILFAVPTAFVWSLIYKESSDRKKLYLITILSSFIFLITIFLLKKTFQGESLLFTNQVIGWVSFEKFSMYINGDHIRMFLYPMLFLLPLGLLGSYQKKEIFNTISIISLTYFIIGGIFIGSGAAVGRYLFSSAGPLLLICQSYLLLKIYNKYYETDYTNTVS